MDLAGKLATGKMPGHQTDREVLADLVVSQAQAIIDAVDRAVEGPTLDTNPEDGFWTWVVGRGIDEMTPTEVAHAAWIAAREGGRK